MGALKVAEDATVVDNTNISIEGTFDIIRKMVEEKEATNCCDRRK